MVKVEDEGVLTAAFVNGLKTHIRVELQLAQSNSLLDLMDWAQKIEEKNWVLENNPLKGNRLHGINQIGLTEAGPKLNPTQPKPLTTQTPSNIPWNVPNKIPDLRQTAQPFQHHRTLNLPQTKAIETSPPLNHFNDSKNLLRRESAYPYRRLTEEK